MLARQGLPLKLAVNIPASILSVPGFVNLMRQSLPADARFPGVIIEVTEDELIGDSERIYEIMNVPMGTVIDLDAAQFIRDASTDPVQRDAALLAIAERRPFVLATVVRARRPTSVRPGAAAVVLADGTIDGFVGGVCAESSVRLYSLRAMETGSRTSPMSCR